MSCIGLRADESRDRVQRVPVSVSARNSKVGRRWIDWLPIRDETEGGVFRTIADASERPPWVHGKGMTRCSCSFCITATPRDLRLAAQLRPRPVTG